MATQAPETTIFINKGHIDISYNILSNKKDDSKYVDCYVPAFNLKFCTTNEENIKKYSRAMIISFFNYYTKKDNFNSLILEIHKMGFRTEMHNFAMKEILNKKRNHAKFMTKNVEIPEEFKNSKVVSGELTEMAY
jgi:hypothetical protein